MEYSKKIYSFEEKNSLLRSKIFYQSVIQSSQTPFEQGELIDEMLGLASREVELSLSRTAKKDFPTGNFQSWGKDLYHGHQTWIGLDPQELQTPLDELLKISELIELKGKKILDLGCGFGRPGMIFKFLESDLNYVGIEMVRERVDAGEEVIKRFKLEGVVLKNGDLFEAFHQEDFNVLFIYDFGYLEQMNQFLDLLSLKKQTFDFIVRGRGMRHLIHTQHLWLETCREIIHQKNFSIYRR